MSKKIDEYRHLPRYENEYPSRVYVIGAVSILIGGFSLMIFSIMRQTIITPSIAFIVLDLFLSFLMFGLIMMAKVYFFTAFHIFIKGTQIIGLNMFGYEKKFELSDLKAITVSKFSKYQIIFKYRESNEMQMSANISDCGKLMEFILDRAENIQHLNIDELPTLESKFGLMWKKMPDWKIINTAKRRAEENKKKTLIKREEKKGT
ncbi:MAG: hypothetical protein ACOYVG_06075 [Bacteroidota bacterium]